MEGDAKILIAALVLGVLFCVVLPLFMRKQKVDPNSPEQWKKKGGGR